MATATLDRPLNALWRQVANVVALLGVIVVNVLANALPINGITSGAVSDRFPTYVTPAGYVFTIWGVIYALLGVFAVYQALPAQRDDAGLQRLGYERLRGPAGSRTRWLAVRLPFSVYLGWVTVATVANTAVALVAAGVDGESAAPLWGAVAIAAATAVGVAMLIRRGDVVFAAVIVWALIGIAVAQGARSGVIVMVAAPACVVLLATAVATLRRRPHART